MKKLCVLLIGVLLAGCTQTAGPRQEVGTVAGALIGAAIGSQFGGNAGARVGAALLGAAIGGVIGNRIGAALDEQDRRQLALITQQTASTGSARAFTSRRTGVKARTRVVANTRNASGQACRTVEQEILKKDGAVLKDTVTACRTNTGWVV